MTSYCHKNVTGADGPEDRRQDLAQAEQTIEAERAIFPTRPELMLNLAAVYARTGRVTQARSLYGQVLEQESVAMDLPDGSVQSSHVLAQRGLLRLGSTIASR